MNSYLVKTSGWAQDFTQECIAIITGNERLVTMMCDAMLAEKDGCHYEVLDDRDFPAGPPKLGEAWSCSIPAANDR